MAAHHPRPAHGPDPHDDRRPSALPLTAALLLGLGLGTLAVPPARSETAPASAARGSGVYLRLGGGLDWPDASVFRDDDCASLQPPALFGCGTGADGRDLGADGGFQTSPVVDAALGYRFTPWLRAEALLSWRPQLEYSGQSNFLGAGPDQPVSGSAQSLAGFGVAYLDLPRVGGVQPFLGAGLGVARNRISAMTYRFPAIAASASTRTPDGSSSDLAYLLTAGISVPLSEQLALDLAYRFTDLGELTTRGGSATVVRPSGSRSIEIGGTQADLQTQGLQLSLRYAF